MANSRTASQVSLMIDQLQQVEFGMTRARPQVTSVGQSSPETFGIDNIFHVRLPIAGTTVKFELFFNLFDPQLTPDIICLGDPDFVPNIDDEVPALTNWSSETDLSGQLVQMFMELLNAFKRFQFLKLEKLYPNLKNECLGNVEIENTEICLESIPSLDPSGTKSPEPSRNWYLHASCQLPSLTSKALKYVSNQEEGKMPIFLHWALSLPSASSGVAPCSSRPGGSRPEIHLLRTRVIEDFFTEFGFKTPTLDATEKFAITMKRYQEAFKNFIERAPQSHENRSELLQKFGEVFPVVYMDQHRWSLGVYTVHVGNNVTLMHVTFAGLSSGNLPVVELVSAYPVSRMPGAQRKRYPVKVQVSAPSLDQMNSSEYLDRLTKYLHHVTPVFTSDCIKG